jgi:hypothetical protein
MHNESSEIVYAKSSCVSNDAYTKLYLLSTDGVFFGKKLIHAQYCFIGVIQPFFLCLQKYAKFINLYEKKKTKGFQM